MENRSVKIKLGVYIIIGAFSIVSCKTKYIQVPVKEKIIETITETKHDTTLITKPDSTWYWAMIECINGKPVITQNKSSGKGPVLNPPKVNLDEKGNLDVSCEARAQELLLEWISKNKQTLTEKEVPVYIEKPLSKWDIFFLEFGKYASFLITILLVLFGTYKFLKK